MPAPISSSESNGLATTVAIRAMEAAGTAVCVADAQRPGLPLVWASGPFLRATGYDREDIESGNCQLVKTSAPSAELTDLGRGESRELIFDHAASAKRKSSRLAISPVHDGDGTLTLVIGVRRDPSGAADHDSLTGLPTRAILVDRIGQALGRLRRREGALGVMFLDFDGFKAVNDRYGHDAGDAFLREVPRRLRTAVRTDDTIARLGGDEFVLLCEDAGGETGAALVAERVLRAFEEPFVLGDERVPIRVSIGIAVAESSDDTPDALLANADAAMYRAKDDGGDGFAIYDSAIRERVNERVGLARDLRDAIGTEQLSLHYQPIVDLGTHRVCSVEALLRWHHPARGHIPPEAFVRVAEETGMIVELGRWVLDRACSEFAATLGDADPELELAVNLSPRQLADAGLPAALEDIMSRTGLGRGRLALEITETALTQDGDAPAERLWALKRLGVRIVLDDFGSGYSSLGHLRRFPIDAIKIDRSFIEGLGTQSSDAAIVGALLPMARALDLAVVAEGVETEGKLAHLYALGCRTAQGFLLARPAPMEQTAAIVRAAPAAVRPSHPQLRRDRARYRAALAAGDADAADAIVRDALSCGFDGLLVQSQVIGPALHDIGEEWQTGRRGRAHEHLASAIAERSLAMLFETVTASRGQPEPDPGSRAGLAAAG